MRRFATESDRLEAFSDGVIAVIITIMVLELHAPRGTTLESLREILPTLLTYLLSFVFVGIYWNNHHHMLRATKGINGPAMWANLHLLFWLSLVPFVTSWLGANPLSAVPTALYGLVLLLNGAAYTTLQLTLMHLNGPDSDFSKVLRADVKGRASLVFYTAAIIAAFMWPVVSDVLFVAVAVMWIVPDRRLEPLIELER